MPSLEPEILSASEPVSAFLLDGPSTTSIKAEAENPFLLENEDQWFI